MEALVAAGGRHGHGSHVLLLPYREDDKQRAGCWWASWIDGPERKMGWPAAALQELGVSQFPKEIKKEKRKREIRGKRNYRGEEQEMDKVLQNIFITLV